MTGSTMTGSAKAVRQALGALVALLALMTVLVATAGHARASGAPAARGRGSVPWSKVGSGWLLATWAQRLGASERLYLIDPHGVRYAVGYLSKNVEVQAWSRDKRHVLLRGDHGVTQFDLRTHRSTPLPSLHDVRIVDYSRPAGAAVLAAVDEQRGHSLDTFLERFGIRGPHLRTYPNSARGAGRLGAEVVTQTADGGELVLGAAHGLALIRSNGQVVRRLLPDVSGSCEPTGTAWAANVALASCGGAMWTVPLSGGRGTQLTAKKSANSPYGNADIWKYSRGRLGLARASCGPSTLVRFDAAGRITPVTVALPAGRHGTPRYRGHHGDIVDMTVTSRGGCVPETATLFAYDAGRGTSRTLLGGPVTGGTVLDALAFPTDR